MREDPRHRLRQPWATPMREDAATAIAIASRPASPLREAWAVALRSRRGFARAIQPGLLLKGWVVGSGMNTVLKKYEDMLLLPKGGNDKWE